MSTTKLKITRDKAFVASAMPYRIYINGQEVAKIKIGNEMTFDIPTSQTTLKVAMVGNAMTFHRIEKEVVLFPDHCKSGIIECRIASKANLIGILTCGLFQAIGHLDITVNYR